MTSVHDYFIEIIPTGKSSIVIQLIEPGAGGVVISRLKQITPELKERIQQALINRGISPKYHRYHRWTVISPLTLGNVKALEVTQELKHVYAHVQDKSIPPHLPENPKVAWWTKGQRAIPLVAALTEKNTFVILKQIDPLIKHL